MKSFSATIEMKAIEQHSVVLIIMLYKVHLTLRLWVKPKCVTENGQWSQTRGRHISTKQFECPTPTPSAENVDPGMR